ncbi:MAG: sigma-54-dependent Fis family transcriptional regulator [Aquificae bacterium]|nr:sigma-54-dependent Fis family transcriptional regulator [Aquificota bacterium]
MKAVVFDDEKTIRNVLKKVLEKEGLEVLTFETGKEAVSIVKEEKPDIVFLDIFMEECNGIDILKEIVSQDSYPFIVMISGHDEYKYIIEAMKHGAYDYIVKPFDINQIRKAVNDIKKSIDASPIVEKPTIDIIGKSPAMRNIFKLIGRASSSLEPVLITGESGTGKEVIARLIHAYSDRKNKPFIAVNCAAIPSGLVESELFGYEKGAFTGATHTKKGKFLVADKGTIFLDEISEMPLEAQGKLLRVIQEMEVTPVGSNNTYKVDVKIITATNKDLVKLTAEGKFREDLFYRLSVIEINVPPLRERKEDIPDLIELFTKQALEKHGLKRGGFTKEAVQYMKSYNYPGNVRELKNIIFKLVAIYRERPITPDLLPNFIVGDKIISSAPSWKEGLKKEIFRLIANNKKSIYVKLLSDFEEILLKETLKHTRGNISEAAKILGIHRNTIHRKIDELNIQIKEKNESFI